MSEDIDDQNQIWVGNSLDIMVLDSDLHYMTYKSNDDNDYKDVTSHSKSLIKTIFNIIDNFGYFVTNYSELLPDIIHQVASAGGDEDYIMIISTEFNHQNKIDTDILLNRISNYYDNVITGTITYNSKKYMIHTVVH